MIKKIYSAAEAPIRVFGLPMLYETGEYRVLPDYLMEEVPSIAQFGHCVTGGRIGFRTNSAEITLRCRVKIQNLNPDTSLLFATGFNVYVGERAASRYIGHMIVEKVTDKWVTIEKTFFKEPKMEEVTIFMASQIYMKSCEIIVDGDAAVEEPTPYKYPVPVVYYGSSITAGGASSRVGNAYTSLLSRWLDADYLNFGFPGNAKGEPEVAHFLKKTDMSVFVYDYDHNAPTPEHLEKTHKPFFDIIREEKPELPIIMLSRPGYDQNPEDAEKRVEIIKDTYNRAVADGDKNVYFISGKDLLGAEDRHAATVDGIHPTDFGFMNMAKFILPTLEKALKSIK